MADNPVESVLDAWRRGKSALLYGPPGTGKTRILSELMQLLNAEDPVVSRLGYDAHDPRNPFQPVTADSSEAAAGLPQPVRTIWMTFHQSLGYEDFIVGLTPEFENGDASLSPQAGVLLDAIIELQSGTGAESVVIFIDEINRGNAAKIFGEFLTFLDFEYRETDANGAPNPSRIPIPIRHLRSSGGEYEPIARLDGTSARLVSPSYFPRHIYVVATMNSVDRTAIPIDSALARRFDRIEIRPDLQVLCDIWGVDLGELAEKAQSPNELTPAEAAILLLDRINLAIAENFGPDFELGHGLMLAFDPTAPDAWLQLARVWDRSIYPQIEDRFSGRPDELAALLRVDEHSSAHYAWRYRTSITGETSNSALDPVALADLSPEVAQSSLQTLASPVPVQ